MKSFNGFELRTNRLRPRGLSELIPGQAEGIDPGSDGGTRDPFSGPASSCGISSF